MKRLSGFAGNFRVELAALLIVTIWGSNFVFQKWALNQFEVMTFTFLRFVGMLILGWGILFLRNRFKSSSPLEEKSPIKGFKISRRDLVQMALAGFLGYTLYISLSIVGLSFTSAFSGSLLIGTSPLFMALLLWALKLERVVARQWFGLGLAFLGLVIFLSETLLAGTHQAGLGDLISLAGAFCFAAYNVANKPLLARYSAPFLTAFTMSLGAIPVLVFSFPFLLAQDWGRITPAGWGALLWSVIFPVYFAWTVWSWVNKKIGVSRTSTFMYLVPVIGGITSWLLLGENFGFQKVAGALITLASLALVRKTSNPSPSPVSEPETRPGPEPVKIAAEKPEPVISLKR